MMDIQLYITYNLFFVYIDLVTVLNTPACEHSNFMTKPVTILNFDANRLDMQGTKKVILNI